METTPAESPRTELPGQIVGHLTAGRHHAAAERIDSAHPAEVAGLPESLPPGRRIDLWEVAAPEQQGEA